MKPLWKIKSLWTAAILAGAVVSLTAGASDSQSSPPEAVVLNGVTAIWGDNRAFFRIPGPNSSSPQAFSLAEGQSANGIQLLSVNFDLESVTINNRGHVQNIHICNPPTVLARANSGKSDSTAKSTPAKPHAGADFSADNPDRSGGAVSNMNTTGPRGGGTTGNPNEKSPGSSSPIADNATSSPSASGDDSNSDPADSQHYVWWYAEAQKIEQARLETAQRVMAGEWPPEPLTPLTPAGTPPQLIGADSVFLKNSWE